MNTVCDYMIIQRDSKGFGNAVFSGMMPEDRNLAVARVVNEENGIVVVPWQKCDVKDGKWEINLTIPEGGLYRIEARACTGEFDPVFNNYDWAEFAACAHHVGVGDIFVMAGQSNMSGYAREPAFDPPELGVHLFNNSGRWVLASHPLCNTVDAVYPNNDGSPGNSPGLAFGRTMKKALGVPVGLVSACLGGSLLESWNPAEENCFLYKSMSDKLRCTGGAAAIIWYQGCSETNEKECCTYYEKFRQAVELWRRDFGNLPVVTCQLNRHAFKGGGDDRFWGIVRDAQRRAALTVPDVYIVPTSDMATCDGIHNSSASCIVIGERMAYTLLKGHYGKPGFFAPSPVKAKQTGSRKIFVGFGGEHTIKTMDNLACGLNIEDEQGLMDCVSVEAAPGGITVTGERDIAGKAVFHAYWRREQPAFFVRDIYGCPMLSCYGLPVE